MIRARSRLPAPGSREGGFTMVEMAVVCAMVAILSVMAIPVARYALRRQNEVELRYQSRGYRWAHTLERYQAPEPARFVQDYKAGAAGSSVVVATAVEHSN